MYNWFCNYIKLYENKQYEEILNITNYLLSISDKIIDVSDNFYKKLKDTYNSGIFQKDFDHNDYSYIRLHFRLENNIEIHFNIHCLIDDYYYVYYKREKYYSFYKKTCNII